MAWDALGNIFQRKQKKDEESSGDLASQASPNMGASAPQQSYASFTGEGGSAGAPARAGFVNFGTLLDVNKDAAAKQAQGVYDKASASVEAARGKLQGARDTFQQQYQQGLGKGTVSGPHGTRIDEPSTYNPDVQAPDWYTRGGTKSASGKEQKVTPNKNNADIKQGSTGQTTRDLLNPDAISGLGGTNSAGAYRYGQLFGPASSVAGEVPDKAGLADYHVSTDLLGAKSGAGQQYTGPESLQDAIGADQYGELAKELSGAEAGAQGLTNAGGISTALGYQPSQEGEGKSALDTGLTQVVGQQNFKRLADQTKGLSKELSAAQADSLKSAEAGKSIASMNAKEWQDLLDQYEKDHAVDPNAPIVIGAAQSEGESGANIGIDKNSVGDNGMSDQFGGIFDTLDSDKGVSEVMSAGYSQQEIMDIWDTLTADEKAALGSKSTDVETGAEAMFASGTRSQLIQSILAKLAAARGKK